MHSQKIRHVQLNSRESAKIKWNEMMKTFLCVLVRCYVLNWEKFTAAFNLAFAESLRAYGLRNGTRSQPLRSQWHHLKHWKDDIWLCVNNTPPAQWAGISLFVEMIERVTRGKIHLLARHGVDIQHLVEMGKNARLRCHADQCPVQQTPPKSPSRAVPASAIPPPAARELPTPSLSPDQSVRPKIIPPPLLFRFWTSNSGGINSVNKFVGGMWAEDLGVPIPDNSLIDTRIISSLIRTHLTRINVASAFISTSTSPLGVFHRALKERKAQISILDTSKISLTQLYPAISYLRYDPIQYGTQGKGRYFGQGEWLVWGAIPPEAILTTFSTSTLFSISSEYPSIGKLLQLHVIKDAKFNRAPLGRKLRSKNVVADIQSGRYMGQLLKLLNVPQSHIAALSMLFAVKWSFQSPGDKRASYLQGVQRGYISAFGLDIPLNTTETDEENEDPAGEYYEDEDGGEDDEGDLDYNDAREVTPDPVVDSFAVKRATITSMLRD
ncbi:hypothetical protein MferCBS31731_002248 [Microsporum ferrugineum]